MKRKQCAIRLTLAAVTAALLLTGCGKRGTPDETTAVTTEPTAATEVYAPVTEPESADVLNRDLGNGLVIESMGRYSGIYFEDGTDDLVSGLFSIQLKNTGTEPVQYAHVTLTQGSETYDFDFSTLPAGGVIRVLEQNRKAMPEDTGSMTAALTTYAAFTEPLSLHEDAVKLETLDSTVTVTNLTGDPMQQVYVYYKTVQNGVFMGGITYRAGVGSLEADGTKSTYTSHFSQTDSQVLFITYVS